MDIFPGLQPSGYALRLRIRRSDSRKNTPPQSHVYRRVHTDRSDPYSIFLVIAVCFTIPEVQIRIGTGGGLRASLLALPCLRTSQRIKAERASQTLFAS